MTTDATQVTSSTLAGDGSCRPGVVLAERYELLEVLDDDGPSTGYRALDQETERQVLVRVLAGPGLDPRTLADLIGRLRAFIGAGGRFLSPLLDADREGRRPFTVEAWPPGTQLSSIFQSRRSRGEPLGPREALPVAARLGAALAALPPPWHHGDVRAERVWVDTDGLRLTGAFLLAVLPPQDMADRLGALGPAAVVYAPELASGRGSAAGDRWGVAAILWEALTLRSPDRTSAPRELAPAVLTALRRLLDPEPSRRPADLASLLDALARQAGLAVPRLDPEPHWPAGDLGEPPGRAAPRGRRIEGAAAEGTQEVSFDQILEEEVGSSERIASQANDGRRDGPDDTAKHAAVRVSTDSVDGLDPRLVRAALGITLESESGARVPDDSLDPRLVRAALGVQIDPEPVRAAPATQSARPAGGGPRGAPGEVVPPRPAQGAMRAPPGMRSNAGPPAPRAGPAPRAEATPSRGATAGTANQSSRPPPPPRAAPAKAMSPPPRRASASGPPPAPASAAVAPRAAPRAAVQARPSPPAPAPRIAAASAPSPAPGSAAASVAASRAAGPSRVAAFQSPPREPASPSSPASAARATPRAASGGEGGTAIVARPTEPAPSPRPPTRSRPLTSVVIVAVALFLAVGIVALGFLVRSMLSEERDSEERTRHIQERMQQIRTGEQSTDNP